MSEFDPNWMIRIVWSVSASIWCSARKLVATSRSIVHGPLAHPA